MNFKKLIGIDNYKIANKHYKNINNVFIIMNGPGTSKLDWDKINYQLSTKKSVAIVTNIFLGSKLIKDFSNLIFLMNDNRMSEFIECEKTIYNKDSKLLINKIFPNYSEEFKENLNADLYSLDVLLNSKNITLAKNFPMIKNRKIEKERQIIYSTNFFQKFVRKFSYVWHQAGESPTNKLNRLGLRLMPTHSRLWNFVKKFNSLKLIWYAINFNQTPNTFYRALDLATFLKPKKVLFIGRNSQMEEWLKTSKNLKSYKLEYKYFYQAKSPHIETWEIKEKKSLLRQIYYESQYLHMMNEVFQKIKFYSLENNICYGDFYDKNESKKFLKENF